MRRVLRLFSPAWLLRHLFALFLIAFFIYMGHWQWTKGESSHGTLQNLFYGIEWWIFTAFVLYLWGKMITEEIHPSPVAELAATEAVDGAGAEPGTPGAEMPGADLRPLVGLAGATSAVARADAPLVFAAVAVPASLAATPSDDEDPEDEDLAAYNAYLASLRTRDSV